MLSFSGKEEDPHCFFCFNLVVYRPLTESNIRKICFFYSYKWFICYHFYDTFCLESDTKAISSTQKLENRSLIIGKNTPAAYKYSKFNF